jgi:protein gp37
MSDKTKIEWTDATWNPFGGCSVTSPGCTNCYAMRIAGSGRLRQHPLYAGVTTPSKVGPVFNGKMTVAAADADVWSWPLRWRGSKTPKLGAGRPSMIFVGDMADLFHESRSDDVIDRVFAVMALAPQHIFQVLTKRPERMREYLTNPRVVERIYHLACDLALMLEVDVVLIASPEHEQHAPKGRRVFLDLWPLPNIWLGVSVEDQATAETRIPLLLSTPAAKRFVSAEPLLGPLALNKIRRTNGDEIETTNALSGTWQVLDGDHYRGGRLASLDWVIVGGESGPHARPMHPDWVRSLRDQCANASVPFFFKQWGEWATFWDSAGDPDYRQFPEVDGQMGSGASRHLNLRGGCGFHGERLVVVKNIGKARAGALLDGVMHREFPK